VLYGVLVATHKGEFWPFSIFPMFSQAGGEWSRAVVREVPREEAPTDWEPLLQTELPGEPLALTDYGLRHDLANLAREEAPTDWEPLLQTELPGEPLALTDYGLRHDLANFIARTERWDDSRVEGLRHMLADPLETRSLLVYRVRGRLTNADSVRVRFIPYAYLTPDTTVLRSDLP
jgi:hypothetical protein